jgi:hypothetical protein
MGIDLNIEHPEENDPGRIVQQIDAECRIDCVLNVLQGY